MFKIITNVNRHKLIIDVYMSPYLVLELIFEFFPGPMSSMGPGIFSSLMGPMLPYGSGSNVTKLLTNMLTKQSVF